ncbi:MAG: hypothetical protein IK078_10005 [Lachnospiraceae bacterium]|nr:hypothetical protein [Lachnospiraceae bacterium]
MRENEMMNSDDVLETVVSASEQVVEEAKETTGIASAAQAVEAMKQQSVSFGESAAASDADEAEVSSVVKISNKWKDIMTGLQQELEEQIEKADKDSKAAVQAERDSAAARIEKETTAIKEQLEKEHADEIKKLTEEKDSEIDRLTKENEELKATLEKEKEEIRKQVEQENSELIKSQYEQQIDSIQTANREKLAAMRREMDGYKEQIETLMLHIDDPFVLQEIQSGIPAQAPKAEEAPAE